MSLEDKVLERVKKMMALANDAGASEGERNNAMRMAYNLLAKHNLSMSDLPTDENHEVREQQETTISADTWARSLANSVAKLFFCSYFYQRTGTAGKDKHFFVGRQSNCITALYMTEYLIKSIKREASQRYSSATSPMGRSFCVGTVSSIRGRVTEMLAADTESTPGNALALVSLHKREQDANEAWIKDAGTNVVTSKPRTDTSLRAGAFFDGKAYGKNVSLSHQVGGTSAGRAKALK